MNLFVVNNIQKMSLKRIRNELSQKSKQFNSFKRLYDNQMALVVIYVDWNLID